MAINKVPFPSSTPSAVADYQKQNALIAALLFGLDNRQKIVGTNVVKGSIFHIGGSCYYADADTAITGVESHYVKLTPSVDTLTLDAAYVASLSGVAWNSTYNGYYDGSGNLYEFDELKALADEAIEVPYKFALSIKNLGSGWATALVAALGSGWATALVATFNYTAGNNVIQKCLQTSLFTGGGETTDSNVDYVSVTEKLYMHRSGIVRCNFQIKGGGSGATAYGKIYKNGVAVGTEYTTTSTSWQSKTEDISVTKGDYLEVYSHTSHAFYPSRIGDFKIAVDSFN